MDDNLKCSVHYLTLSQVGYEEKNTAVSFYHDRTHFDATKRNLYAAFAEEFSLQQGRQFVLHNRIATTPSKMSKLKDQVKELDELLANPANRVVKLSWVSSARLLICLENASLIWLAVDPMSGDLLRVCVDPTLREHIKLSGRLISDLKFIRSFSRGYLIVVAFSDQSRVDFIEFGKASHFGDYLSSGSKRDAALEKLSVFEPSLIKVLDLQCPSTFTVNKKIILSPILDDLKTSNLTIWWSNQFNPDSNESAATQSLSLLERNDLRTNVVVLNTNIGQDPNLYEYLAKSDGCLLALAYNDGSSLIAVEQFETSSRQCSIEIYKHNIHGDSGEQSAISSSRKTKPKQRLIAFNINSRVISSDLVKISKRFIALLTSDQTLIVYDINRNCDIRLKLSSDKHGGNFISIEWLLDDLFFCLYNESGKVVLFDVALNQLDMSYATRNEMKFGSMCEYLNEKLCKNNRFEMLSCSNSIEFDSLWSCFVFSKGPLGLFRIRIPLNFNCIALMTHYLKSSQIDELTLKDRYLNAAVRLMTQMDWDCDGYAALSCLYKLMNFLFNMDSINESEKFKQEQLCEKTLSTFYKPITSTESLKPSTIRAFRHPISRYARRFFFLLVSHGSLESAYRLAIDLNSTDLFVDLYHCALERGERALAHLCAERAKQTTVEGRRNREGERSISDELDGLVIMEREADEVSESDEDDDIDNVQERKSNRTSKKSSSAIKAYTEQDIENYAKKVIGDNMFLYNLKLDSF